MKKLLSELYVVEADDKMVQNARRWNGFKFFKKNIPSIKDIPRQNVPTKWQEADAAMKQAGLSLDDWSFYIDDSQNLMASSRKEDKKYIAWDGEGKKWRQLK